MENIIHIQIVLKPKESVNKSHRRIADPMDYSVADVLRNFWDDDNVMHFNQN